MYAAAGGASIANRRKQKRLQQKGSTAAPPLSKLKVGAGAGALLHHHHHHHHQHQHSHQHASSKYARASQNVVPAPPAPSSSSHAFHHSRRRPEQLAPVSPIPLFPISPPPLSIESSPAPTAKSKFPFPPSSILDLRGVPSTSELQCSGGPGKAAWQGCNRPSPLPDTPISPHGSKGEGYKTKQCEAHRRWMKRNRIRDASYCYGSSGEEDDDDENSSLYGRRGEVSAAVNTMLYAGLGTTALGLVISFVGTGEKGFLSPELRLIGPSLLCAGLLCCLLRVLLCLCLCKCTDCRWRHVSDKQKSTSKMEAAVLPTASLLPPPPVKQKASQSIYKKHLQASPPSPQLDTKSCTAPLSLTPSPSPSPTPIAQSSSTTNKLNKEAELLLSPSQLYDPADT